LGFAWRSLMAGEIVVQIIGQFSIGQFSIGQFSIGRALSVDQRSE
jgi:hypothetical protein